MEAILRDRPEVEYLDGIRHPKVSPRSRHALVQAAMWQILSRCAGKRGFAGTEWRFVLVRPPKRTLFVPDVAFVSAERLRALPPAEREEPTVSPDVAIEVRSPQDDVRYLRSKIRRYLECGALLVIDVDPRTRTLTAHTIGAERTLGDGDRFSIDVVPWLTFDVDEVFAEMDAFERL